MWEVREKIQFVVYQPRLCYAKVWLVVSNMFIWEYFSSEYSKTQLPLCKADVIKLSRFALDWAGLYGGDEYAMKAASHELKSLASVYDVGANVNGARLCVPFMVLIDELGFR